MKVIDILNKKANRELEDGFKFAYKDRVYTYSKEKDMITNGDGNCIGIKYCIENRLVDEVLLFKDKDNEVIEENKEIEELDYEIESTNLDIYITENKNKINEIIRKINKEREKK